MCRKFKCSKGGWNEGFEACMARMGVENEMSDNGVSEILALLSGK